VNIEINKHMTRHKNERQAYIHKCEKAAQRSDKYMSVIVDGSSHKEFPYKYQFTKALENKKLLKVRCFALLNHRDKRIALAAPHLAIRFKPDPIHICTEHKQRGKLPPVLYLQLDNCYRENKNVYVLSFLEWLVLRGIFVKVRLSFMFVGHTHCDIDQLHSVWIKWTKHNNCDTPSELIDQISKIMTKSSLVSNVYNWKAWIEPHMHSMSGHSGPHCMKILRNDNGTPVLYYKQFSCKEESWKGGEAVLRDQLLDFPQPLAPKKIDSDVLTNLRKLMDGNVQDY